MLFAAVPSFESTSQPAGWTVVRGQTMPAAWLQSQDGAVNTRKETKALLLQTAAPLSAPVQATFRFRAAVGDTVTLRAITTGAPEAKEPPLLECQFALRGENQAALTARADGQPMATDITATRTYRNQGVPRDTEQYGWRYPMVRNLWDERDRNEIGLAFSRLTPFTSKIFTARLVVTPDARQIWVDDRLLAEARSEGPKQLGFSMELQ
jgi:hypothetical protein